MTDTAPQGRTAAKIIEEISLHPENALAILSGLNDYEHFQLAESSILVGLQRARGLQCYEAIAAYCIGAERENKLVGGAVREQRARADQLFGILNTKVLTDKILAEFKDDDIAAGYRHLQSLDQ